MPFGSNLAERPRSMRLMGSGPSPPHAPAGSFCGLLGERVTPGREGWVSRDPVSPLPLDEPRFRG